MRRRFKRRSIFCFVVFSVADRPLDSGNSQSKTNKMLNRCSVEGTGKIKALRLQTFSRMYNNDFRKGHQILFSLLLLVVGTCSFGAVAHAISIPDKVTMTWQEVAPLPLLPASEWYIVESTGIQSNDNQEEDDDRREDKCDTACDLSVSATVPVIWDALFCQAELVGFSGVIATAPPRYILFCCWKDFLA
jgi:hypothetical protein